MLQNIALNDNIPIIVPRRESCWLRVIDFIRSGWGTGGSSIIMIVFVGTSISGGFCMSLFSYLDLSSSQLETLSAIDTSS